MSVDSFKRERIAILLRNLRTRSYCSMTILDLGKGSWKNVGFTHVLPLEWREAIQSPRIAANSLEQLPESPDASLPAGPRAPPPPGFPPDHAPRLTVFAPVGANSIDANPIDPQKARSLTDPRFAKRSKAASVKVLRDTGTLSVARVTRCLD